MPANFTLVLDTTSPLTPTLAINAGAAFASAQAATANISTGDASTTGYQILVWGSVDTAANTSIQATEGTSAWIAYNAAQPITLSATDGVKTINMRIRDDVGNQTAVVTDTITLDTTIPVVSISVAFSPTKVSKVATFDTVTGSFQSDTAAVAWKVKVVPATNSTESAGTQIPTTAGSANVTGGALAAATNQSVTIKGTDLEAASAGDGNKIVKIFCQESSGAWSV